jgi:hypothetical protein
LIPDGVLVIVPFPVPVLETLRINVLRVDVNDAMTDLVSVIGTWQDPVPEQ